ncbi:MAG TPA: beta-galactosidase [Candidatus Saccharimonadales bacterium]
MRSEHAHREYRPTTRVKHFFLWPFKALRRYYQRGLWQRLVVFITAALVLWIGSMYGIAQWYISSNKHKPLELGASFIPAYAEGLGLNAKETMDAMLNDLDIRHLRLVSYWSQLEPEQGKYDFSLLDWQFEKAEAAGAKVTLSLGLRQPRWPECHIPAWARQLPSGNTEGTWQKQLEQFMTETINRYKGSPALDSYQLENEYFLRGFGECEQLVGEQAAFDRNRLISEYNLIKQLDPYHKLIISRSNNALGTPIGKPTPDEFGISIYKRVWDANLTKRYLEYPFPAWFYGFVAGSQKILTGKDMIIHELQAEAWPPGGNIPNSTLEEQNKSFNAERFKHRVEFGKATGMREIYLWGAEYWYYRKVKLNDPSLWNVAKDNFAQYDNN